jgi:hypothetical protein
MTLTDAIRELYAQVAAPAWAAANLDALVDVLRDLSWLPEGPVVLVLPAVDGPDAERLRTALEHAAGDTADGPRPVRLLGQESGPPD